MHRRTWLRFCAYLAALGFLFGHSARSWADTACVEPAQLAHASVSIAHYFDAAERAAQHDDSAGIQGSGWFLTPTAIVTVAHVAVSMNLSTRDWRRLEIRDGDVTRTMRARIARLVGHGSEKIAVLEIDAAFPAAHVLAPRSAPLAPNERVVAPAFPSGRLRVVAGRFDSYAGGGEFGEGALLEMYDGNDRLAIDYGASGAPVVDCESHVVAVVANVVTQTLRIAGGDIRVSTAWGMPNVVSVPVQALQESSEIK